MRNLRVSNRPAVCCSRATEMEHSHCARERDRGNLGWLSQSNRILTLIIILLLLFCALSVSPSCPLCSHLSLSVSSTPLADSLTGSVPLANHSALIMRIISSHHSPRCASSISSGLFTRHQPLHVNPFICSCVCVFVPQCAAHKITLNNI